jgi:hypothetical protein
MQPIPKKVTRAALLALPERKWDAVTVYDFIYIVPTKRKHDSGWTLQAIIGAVRQTGDLVGEIAAYCDDVCWSFPLRHPYDGIKDGKHGMIMRTDCHWPSGIFRIWASGESYFCGRFKVGCALSSTDVDLVLEPVGDPSRLRERIGLAAPVGAFVQ